VSLPRRTAVALAAAAALFGAAQLVPVRRSNPPVEAPLRPPADVAAILQRSCGDCHSNETRWPWYARLAPASWLVARDVQVGRKNLDYSYWGQLSSAEQRREAQSIVGQVTSKAMPYRPYLILHPRARLSADEVKRLREWFSSPEAWPGPSDDARPRPAGSGGEDGRPPDW
jgi:hypothetical protein